MGTTAACSKFTLSGLDTSPICTGGDVLGERTAAGAKHLVPRPERRHAGPDRLDTPGHIPAEEWVLGRADAEAGKAHRVRHPPEQMPDALVDARGDHAQQHLALARDRRSDLAEP